jgi:hypothetical protein
MNPERQRFLSLTHLPARLNPEETGWYLAFKTKEIPRLARAKLLMPLGNPGRAATKYYAEIELRRLRNDIVWLNKATALILTYWHTVNEKKQDKRKPKRHARPSRK